MLGRIGKTLAALRDGMFTGTSRAKRGSAATALPLNLVIARPRHLPIWEIRQRPRSVTKLPQAYIGKAMRGMDWVVAYARLPLVRFDPTAPQPLKRRRRQTWRAMRRELPPMSGRQWRKMRQAMFHSAQVA